ncbi:MAG TPA: TonB-dependent receptor [Gemmatimonadaceae bacterium]|nr:TonB-dependent receptor [Gemmatimonadaceae bacterium]
MPHRLVRILAAGGLALPAAAFAQRAPTRDSVATLPGVTVSATRSPSAILTTPLAITKINAPELRAISGFGLDEALSRVPGVIAQSRYGTSDIRLMIRGYGARGAGDRSNSGTSRGVRVLLDGFPETEPDGRTALDQLDLATAEAVEVIRSNASSLWGNAAGGVVNVITVPSLTTPSFEAQPVFGGFGLARYAARTSTPIGDNSGVIYANFTNTSFDGWRDHSDARRALINGGAVGQVGSSTRLGLFVTAANNLMHVPGPLTRAQVDANPNQANPTYLQRDERRYNRVGRLGVSVDHEVSSTFSLSSMVYVNPKYLQRSERNTFRDFTRYHVGGNVVARKALNTAGTRSIFTLGMDEAYQDGAILFYTLSPTTGRGTTLTDNKGEGANNVGVFLQDELNVNSRLTLLLGARYDAVAYSYRSFLPAPPVRSDRRDFSRVSPKLGVNWLVNATSSLYANVGGGIEVPAGNETDPTPGAPPALLNPLLDAIRSTTYEVGFKSVPQMGADAVALGYDIALYDIEVTNEIVPYNGGRYYLTAAKARRQGAEVGLNAVSRAGLFGNAALTFSNNKYANYVVDSAVIFPTDPTKAGKRADYSDNKVVGVPSTLANIEVGTSVPGFRSLRLKAGVEHSGKYFADDANRVEVPSYTILNMTAELRDPIVTAGNFGVRGFVSVKNLTDKRYIGSAFLNPDLVAGAPAAFEPGMPRAFIVSLSVGRLR